MEIVKDSLTGGFALRLRTLLVKYLPHSIIARFCGAAARGVKALCGGSAILGYLSRARSSVWEYSLLYRLLYILANLVPFVLNFIYDRLKRFFEGSIVCRVIFAFGEQASGCLCWMMLAVLIIPQEQWNNMYSLMGAFGILFVHYLGAARNKSLRTDVGTPGPYAVLFLAAVTLSVIFSYDFSLSYRYFFFHVTCALLVLVCVSTIKSADELVRVLCFTMTGLIICCLYAVYQRVSGLEVNRSFVDVMSNANMPGRVFSFFENPNAYAKILVMLMPFGLAMIFCCRKWGARLIGFVAFILAAAALVMTISRAGWGGAVISVLLLALFLKPALIPVLIVCGIASIPFLPQFVVTRLTAIGSGDTSITTRVPVYSATMKLVGENMVDGVGLGMDVIKRAIKEGRLYTSYVPFIHAHNTYLQIWAETGIFGLLSFLMAMAYCIRRAAAAVRCADKTLRGLAAAGASGLVGVLVFGLADYIWAYPRVMVIFWFVFGITLTAARLANATCPALNKKIY